MNQGNLRGLGLQPFVPNFLNQLPAAVDGSPLVLDSTQPGGIGFDTRSMLNIDGSSSSPAYSFASESTLGVYRAASTVVGVAGTLKVVGASRTITGTGVLPTLDLSATETLTFTGLGPTFGLIQVGGTRTLVPSTGSGANVLNFVPAFTTAGTMTEATAVNVVPTYAGAGSYGTVWDLYIGTGISAGCTTYYAIDIESSSSTATTGYGLHIGTVAGVTQWAIAVANINSYHQGKFAFGAAGTAPTWDIHVIGGNAATSGIGIDVSTTGPTAPASNGSGVISVYKGTTNYYLLVTFNDAGTTRYRYMQLNGTTATWTEGTTLPT